MFVLFRCLNKRYFIYNSLKMVLKSKIRLDLLVYCCAKVVYEKNDRSIDTSVLVPLY